MENFFLKLLAFLSILLAVGCLVFCELKISGLQHDKTVLQNQVAEQSKTIETSQGVYQRLTQTNDSLSSMLDSKNAQIAALLAQVKHKDEQILSASNVIASWKKAYESDVKATQTTVPPTQNSKRSRERVDFSQDFGYIGVQGYTLTDPPEGHVKVQQNRPLRITLALTERPDHTWSTYATSSEENVSIDIGVTAVNPYILEPKWYEKIGFMGSVEVGSTANGLGLLGSVGLTYKIGKVELGPELGLAVTDHVDKYLGLGLIWHPFERAQ